MELNMDLDTKQTQRLVLSPDMKQSLEILQYTSQDLLLHIQTELEKNPLLEINEDNHTIQQNVESESYPMDWKEYFKSINNDNRGLEDPVYTDDDNNYENMVSTETTLHEYMMFQLEVMDMSLTDRRIGAFIIENLNDNGYLTISKNEIASILSIDRRKAGEILKIIQSLDPPGVGARSLRECLIIQLKQRNQLTADVKAVILEHLSDVAENNYPRISHRLKLNVAEVQRICDIIKRLEPKPGRPFASRISDNRYIVPDVEVELNHDDYRVSVRETAAPRLRLNRTYQDMLSSPQSDIEVVNFLTKRLNAAHRLIKAVERRRETLANISSSIIGFQRDFIEYGIAYLKPLTLKMVADDVGLHESTVSRGVNGKYIQTPRGVFELKYFFDSGITNMDGSGISSQSIKEAIGNIIGKEDEERPLSDNAITGLLNQRGIDISRRTVAKYREEMGILNSNKRKRG